MQAYLNDSFLLGPLNRDLQQIVRSDGPLVESHLVYILTAICRTDWNLRMQAYLNDSFLLGPLNRDLRQIVRSD
jgi:hypothetical protein